MTELVWDGKYAADGKRVSPLRIALPFQTVETVNESAQERQLTLESLFRGGSSEWRNRLIWGDKKYVLPSLLPEFAGKVDLIYIDPPFDTGANFSFTRTIPDSDALFVKEPSIIELKAYRDIWGRGTTQLDSYLMWFYETVVLLHELLAETGSLYVHLDWHIGHYAKAILDEVFCQDNFRNEIYWYYYNKMPDTRKGVFPRATDTIFWYVKNRDARYTFNALTEKRDSPVHQLVRKKVDGKMVNARDEQGNVLYQTREERVVDNVWRINMLQPADKTENVGYATQKPEALLDRIIKASSNKGDLVFDCFCGSGTTAVVAEKLGRRWIACDLGRFAIQTTRKRLLSLPDVRPFVVQNLGKYERQAWQAAEFAQPDQEALLHARYRRFILDLYHAEPLEGYAWLHGLKNGHYVHVGAVDAPVTVEDTKAVARECWKAGGRHAGDATNAADVLGWDFAFDVHETAAAIAAEANVKLSFKRIPREVLEKKAVEQGDIRFFELAALDLGVATNGRCVTISLCSFMVPPDDVPADVQAAITHWSQWIDYWAVDWDFRDDTFHNQWQSYRTRSDPKLQCSVAHTYEAPGRYTVVVKVIDILGNDTTKSVVVEV